MSTTTQGQRLLPPKRLALFFDGTWNAADSKGDETNVARLARAVQANSGDKPQIALYLRGVGTTGSQLQQLLAGATGDGVDENIRAAYMFLCQNYLPQDEIFLFGFSRGAFTARSLAGFIGKCGLLKRQQLGLVRTAWAYYRSRTPGRSPQEFNLRHGGTAADPINHAPRIRFVGVWDTVGALGIPDLAVTSGLAGQYAFHDTSPAEVIDIGRHALAIDERRGAFVPTLWTQPVAPDTNIQQVWFPGVHADIGGGYGQSDLAMIPLRWMADEAKAAGLALDEKQLPQPATLRPLAPQHDSDTGFTGLGPNAIRAVLEANPTVGPMATLYFPRDATGARLQTAGESLHPSVALRRGQLIDVLDGNGTTLKHNIPYRPVNLP
jgi:uncharacterized protein (DUF2235 family)